MTSQYEHNKKNAAEIMEHSIILDAISKKLDEVNKKVSNLQLQFAQTEELIGKIFDKQTTLVNRMAAKPESFPVMNHDEDLEMIGVSPIESLFTSLNVNDKGTGGESTLVKERPVCLEGDDSNAKTEKVGMERLKP